jgi:hypothetical protein
MTPRIHILAIAVVALLVTAGVQVSAQFGHPLKGQWSG